MADIASIPQIDLRSVTGATLTAHLGEEEKVEMLRLGEEEPLTAHLGEEETRAHCA